MPRYIGHESEYDLGGINYLGDSQNSVVRNGLVLYLDAAKKNFVSGALLYRLFNTNGSNPTTKLDFDAFFNQSAIATGVHTVGEINWENLTLKPSYIPSDVSFAWEVRGVLRIEDPGSYIFNTRSDDGNQLEIDGNVVTSFYGGRGVPTPGDVSLPVFMNQGYYSFRYRMQQGAGGAGAQVRWQKPGSSSYEVIPQSSLGYFDIGTSGAGTGWSNLINNASSATIQNGALYSTSDSGSLNFDGFDDDILAPASLSMSSFTVSYWIYLDNTIDWNTRFDICSTNIAAGTSGRFLMYRLDTTVVRLYLMFPTLSVYFLDIDNANALLTGKWRHITFSGNTVGSNTTLTAYVDGVFYKTVVVPEAATATVSTFHFMRNNGPSSPTKGKLSLVTIYNRQLSAAEVAQNVNATRGRYLA
jgi:hypothetical protein